MSTRELQPFDTRTLLGLIGLGAVAFLAMAWLMVAGEQDRIFASPTSTSRSAIGYRAFVELLRHFDLPTAPPSTAALADGSLRIVLAPKGPQDVRQAMRSGLPVLIVLPKWRGYARPFSDRVSEVLPHEQAVVQAVAREIAADAEIVRPDTVGAWQNASGVQGTPTLEHPQLVKSAELCPLVSSEQGILIGQLCRRPSIAVLADADLLANHGLWRGDNAVLVLSVVTRLRQGTGPIVALEPVSEAAPAPTIWRLAISPPFVLITLAALVAAAIALWSAAMRFGPAQAEGAPRPAGMLNLIDVAARLLSEKGEASRLLRRYADLLTLDLGRRLRAPAHLQGTAEIGAWLDSSRRPAADGLSYRVLARRADIDIPASRAGTAAALSTAAELHRWHEDLLNGR
jgi:hypothetical protein